MTTLEALQNYWWLLICVLGALLVLMLMVQGGQSMLMCTREEIDRTMMVNSLGRKWELTFTTLVVFGGAFFASFPLFYSTSFGGAYWLWMLILFSFVIQAVSYEFRRKPGNIFGTRTYDCCLLINGCVGCILLGVAVAMMFFGAEFDVAKGNILDGSAPVISTWAPTHGLEAIVSLRCLCLGVAVLFLARTQAALYFLNNIDGDERFAALNRRRVLINGLIFVVFFLGFLALIFFHNGWEYAPDGSITEVYGKYFWNLLDLWWFGICFVLGVLMVLYAIGRSAFDAHWKRGIWWSGLGTVLVVVALLAIAGYNNTPYYPSLLNPEASLTIRNSSSTQFTLTVMTWVSGVVPIVVAYIAYVWYRMDRQPITPAEMEAPGHKY
ncbi:MAG: cytochrome d ubiquinol oxidase subunit II [Bacteroidales bacterium]|nr:cytochrome d ubiquinol oxidase subunit II [Bacteroidales bacterium]